MAQKAEDPATENTQAKERRSKFSQIWAKAGLDFPTVAMMFKASTAPTIAIAMFQSDAIANHFSSLGYLIAIMSILGMPIMPRGKFIQTMLLNVFAVCLGVAINLLALYSATQARAHTSAPGASPTAYNSSASAICGVWMFFQLYLINYLRAARPQFQMPAIICSIFAMVSLTYGPSMPNMTAVLSFEEQLIEAFLTGFALATGVHFVIIPVTSRTVVLSEMKGFVMSTSGVLKAHAAIMHELEEFDPIALERNREEAAKSLSKKGNKKSSTHPDADAWSTPTGQALQTALGKVIELYAKTNGDIPSAKREFALGKLETKDITQMWKITTKVITPIMGLRAVFDLIKSYSEQRHWSSDDLPEEEMQANRESVQALHKIMKSLHEPFDSMTELIGMGYNHVLITLEIIKPPKKKTSDEENKATEETPGSSTFPAYYKHKLDDFEKSKEVTLEDWCQEKGIDLSADFFHANSVKTKTANGHEQVPDRLKNQLFLLLYLEYLLLRVGQAVLELILFAEGVKQQGRLKKTKLIFPGSKTLRRWVASTFGREDMSQEDHFLTDMQVGATESLYLGESFGKKKDPEHLPPRNTREKFGDRMRLIPAFFRTDSSAFSFRVACATMSIAITAYLEQSQQFFLQQRILWSLIMIAISMTRTAGQSTFNFIARVFGTAVAMAGAYVVWYIVDGNVPGVIVFLWLWMSAGFYVVLKFPNLVIVGILSAVTVLLIIGYELQVVKLGTAVAEANGQTAYPTYLLAPYRLATVAGGLFVAWIWTIWPFPVSENAELRKDIGASLYLLANFYSIVHETVQTRIKGDGGDILQKGTHNYRLEKAKHQVFGKLLALLGQLQLNAKFAKFQLNIGGKFPIEEYESMIECVRRILGSIALISHASETLATSSAKSSERSTWSKDFRRLTTSIGPTSHRVTSTLSLLSSSLTNGQPLPPYIEMPKPYEFVQKLQAIDEDIMSVRHIAEPEYSAVVVTQFCGDALQRDISKLTRHIKTLVGEIDFSFHVISTSEQSSSSSLESDEVKDKLQ